MRAAGAVGDPLKRAEPTRQRHLPKENAFHPAARSYKTGTWWGKKVTLKSSIPVQVDIAAAG